jgi:hypothetical protein
MEEANLWNSHSLKVGSIGHWYISSSDPLNWRVKVLKAFFYDRHAATNMCQNTGNHAQAL